MAAPPPRILERLQRVKQSNGKWTAQCPAHDDRHNSLSISVGDDGRTLVKCFAGCDTAAVMATVGMTMADLAPAQKEVNLPKNEIINSYDYHDKGLLRYQVVRFSGKEFRQRRPYKNTGNWVWGLTAGEYIQMSNGDWRKVRDNDGPGGPRQTFPEKKRIHYHRQEVIDAVKAGKTIHETEGEKDTDNLRKLGFAGTTIGGVGTPWRSEHSEDLRGADVVVWIDADEPGRKRGKEIATALQGIAKSVKVIEPPGVPAKGDISDYIAAGHTKADIEKLVADAPEWMPESTKSKIRFASLKDLLREPEQEFQWLVNGLFPCGGVVIFSSKPKVGKTTLARYAAWCVAAGRPFLGCEVRQGAVYCLFLEEIKSEVIRHFRRMGVSGFEPIYIFAECAPKDGLTEVTKTIQEVKPALLIIDPLFRLVRVKNGDDYIENTTALEEIVALARKSGTTILLVHHSRKMPGTDGDDILGSIAILGSVDTALILRKGPDGVRTISTVQRYGPCMDETVLALDDCGQLHTCGTRAEMELTKVKDAMLAFLGEQSEPVTESVISETIEVRRQVKVSALRELVREGKLARHGKGGKGGAYTYTLSSSVVPNIQEKVGTSISECPSEFTAINRSGLSSLGLTDDYGSRFPCVNGDESDILVPDSPEPRKRVEVRL